MLLLVLAILPLFPITPSFSQPPGMRLGLKPWKGEVRCWKASELNLSQDQLKGLDALQLVFFRETQISRAQIFAKRLELRELLTNPNARTETIRSKLSEILEQQAKLEEKSIEHLIKVRSLLTQEQLKNWCPEFEFPPFRRMMPGPNSTEPMPSRRPPPPEGAKPEQ